jgi:hypothetical protein
LIQELAYIAEVHDLYKLEKFDYRVQWLNRDGEDIATEADRLNISYSDFWFAAYLKYTNIEITSEKTRITHLDAN